MSRFSIHIVQPRGWSNMRLFLDVADSLAYALRRLGHEVIYDPGRGELVLPPKPSDGKFGRSIILGPTFLPDVPLAPDAILFNFEQVPWAMGSEPGEVAAMISDAWLRGGFLDLYRRHEVWDYSAANIERLGRLGVLNTKICRVGYTPTLERISQVEEDIDVLFIGTMRDGDRRHDLFKKLQETTVTVVEGQGTVSRPLRPFFLAGVYGAERDALIARAKVVLNVHANEPKVLPAIFEIMRCSLYFANRKCVVTENGDQDPELEALARSAAISVPYDEIPGVCAALVEDEAVRRQVGERGYATFRVIDQVVEVQKALGDDVNTTIATAQLEGARA